MKKVFCVFVFAFVCAAFHLCAFDDISEIVKRVAFEEEQQNKAFEHAAVQYIISLQQKTAQKFSLDARAIQDLYTDSAARGSYEDAYTVK